jgi:hypothetical protein
LTLMNPYDKHQQQQDIEKYGLLVHPYADDDAGTARSFTFEQSIRQSKALRSYFWDTCGTTGRIPAEWFELRDKEIADMEKALEQKRAFEERFGALSDENLLGIARSWLVTLTAEDNNATARKLGVTDEYIENLRAHIADLEKAVEDEKKAIWKQQKDVVAEASKDLLDKLGPSSKPFILTPPKKPGDADAN